MKADMTPGLPRSPSTPQMAPLLPDPCAPATRRVIEGDLRAGRLVEREAFSGSSLAALIFQTDDYYDTKHLLPIPDEQRGVVDLRREPQRRWRDLYVAEPDPETMSGKTEK
jgi:hypothetical protein